MANTLTPDVDRLPWLTDERVPSKGRGRWWLLPLIVVAMVAIAGVSFWFGAMRNQLPATASEPGASAAEVTTALPAPVPADPVTPNVEPSPMPEVAPAPLPAPVFVRQQQEIRIASERQAARRTAQRQRVRVAKAAPAKVAVQERKTLQFSNPWESAEASGRMVRVGTYSSLRQGKQAWSRLAGVYPAMKRLPAVVTDIPSLRNGRVYYRLQIGTTSQAHSEVLCQRMKAIGQSCVVVDLAGARRGSGDERQPVGI
jgi:hypothetical protein